MTATSKAAIMANTFQFLDVPRQDPDKEPARIRIRKFGEIQGRFEPGQAASQAQRCLDCGSPYCEWKCPGHHYIPNWLQVNGGRHLVPAAGRSHHTNPVPRDHGRL